jgi:tubulin--tyrosine ligase
LSSSTYIGNAYTIRKALIRKHYLAHTVESWLPKHPESPLKQHVPLTISFELDYAEFLDDALLEACELKESWEKNAGKDPAEREWWILKPGMSDRGQGIRLFSSEEQLQAIFDEWEAENPEEEEGDGEEEISRNDDEAAGRKPGTSDEPTSSGMITSQLRHFVVQPYIPPLLIPGTSNRKFHIRCYVLCVGALSVFVHKDMLALFAPDCYIKPGQTAKTAADDFQDDLDMRRHLTNTCLQDGTREGSVLRYWALPSSDVDLLKTAFDAICTTTGELFRAATANPTTFQPLPNAFEVFGVDWLLDERGIPKLLEVNAFPDFKQSGADLTGVVGGFWKDSMDIVGRKLLGVQARDRERRNDLVEVLDLDLGRR